MSFDEWWREQERTFGKDFTPEEVEELCREAWFAARASFERRTGLTELPDQRR